jgi:hypothetical protein
MPNRIGALNARTNRVDPSAATHAGKLVGAKDVKGMASFPTLPEFFESANDFSGVMKEEVFEIVR